MALVSRRTAPPGPATFHAGLPRCGHVAHRNASPFAQLPHPDPPDDLAAATAADTADASAPDSSISLRLRLGKGNNMC
jgi:hypothetical protein